MEYRIEKKDAFQLVSKRKQINRPQGDEATADISSFWSQCEQDGALAALCTLGRFDHFGGILGVCFSGDMADSGFPYGIGAEYNGAPVTDSGFDLVNIPSHTYAVFTCKGKMPDAFQNTYQQICTEFFPQSNYEYGKGVELEVYPSADVQNPDYCCEIWISVKEKK